MIAIAMKAIVNELNNYLQRALGNELNDTIVITNLVKHDGSRMLSHKNKIICTIVNQNQDRSFQNNYRKNAVTQDVNPEMILKINLQFTSTYDENQYLDGINIISHIISYFFSHSVFDRKKNSPIPENIDRIICTKSDLSISELSTLWLGIGIEALPCVHYSCVISGTVNPISIVDEITIGDTKIT